jgi:hypothetical protein
VADRLHEVRLAHTDAAVEEQRVVSLGGPLGDGLASRVCELVPAADDERVERITRIQLRSAVPIESPLRRMERLRTCTGTRTASRASACTSAGTCEGMSREAAVVSYRRVRRIVFGGNELYILVAEPEVVDRFLNQVGIFIANVTELGRRNAHEENAIAGVAVACGLQPGVVGVAIDFLFQSVKNARPRIRDDGRTGERHFLPEC